MKAAFAFWLRPGTAVKSQAEAPDFDIIDFAVFGGRIAFFADDQHRIHVEKATEEAGHVRAFAQHVEVADDAIYINGSKNTLSRA